MHYKPKLGVFGNLQRLINELTKTNNTADTDRINAENYYLEVLANQVEAVIDEYNALTGEESEE